MRPLIQELSRYNKFSFENPPVGSKFLFHKPEEIGQIDKKPAFCEMIKDAQQGETPFYFTKENGDCFGTVALGIEDAPPILENIEIGIKTEIFQDLRANTRLYQYLPKLEKGTVNYVALSPIRQTDIRAGPLGTYGRSQPGGNRAEVHELFDGRDMGD